jgi:hypothetical protein
MDSEIFTMGALAVVLAGAWLIDLLGHRSSSPLEREMTRQLKKSAETIRGKL